VSPTHRLHREILGTPVTVTARWDGESACAAAAARLAQAWRAAAADAQRTGTITLTGGLGAGKTTFARHLLRALGITGPVKSPTYTLIEPYEVAAPGGGTWPVAHCDFYRFADPREWEEAGLRDVFSAPGLRLVEWPQKAGDLMGPADLAITIERPADAGDDVRDLVATAATAVGLHWLSALSPPRDRSGASGDAGEAP
jgi:tRNA threonylcarbamoyladenosine biosynthesis protein TsaE